MRVEDLKPGTRLVGTVHNPEGDDTSARVVEFTAGGKVWTRSDDGKRSFIPLSCGRIEWGDIGFEIYLGDTKAASYVKLLSLYEGQQYITFLMANGRGEAVEDFIMSQPTPHHRFLRDVYGSILVRHELRAAGRAPDIERIWEKSGNG